MFGGGRGEVLEGASEAAAAKAARATARHARTKASGGEAEEEEEGDAAAADKKKQQKKKQKKQQRGRRSSFTKDLKAARASMLEAAPNVAGEGEGEGGGGGGSQCAGYLQKLSTGGFRKAWQTRYFVVAVRPPLARYSRLTLFVLFFSPFFASSFFFYLY